MMSWVFVALALKYAFLEGVTFVRSVAYRSFLLEEDARLLNGTVADASRAPRLRGVSVALDLPMVLLLLGMAAVQGFDSYFVERALGKVTLIFVAASWLHGVALLARKSALRLCMSAIVVLVSLRHLYLLVEHLVPD
jgi:hypothetical protein